MMFWVSVIAGVLGGSFLGGAVISAMEQGAAVFGILFGALVGGCVGDA